MPIIWAVARYNITFTGQNLPAGTEWYINVSGANHVSSTSGNISLDLPNGTYGYTFASGSPYFSGGNATLDVRGSGMTIPVHFTPLFAVSVNAGALPAGSLWYINFTSPGGFFRNVSGTSGTLTAILPNGTYEYSAWYPASDSEKTGSVTVDGRNSTISADFHRTSVISFRESGLPQGTKWSVRFNGTLKSSNGSYLNFTVRDGNGTFSFEVPDVTGYTVSRPSGSISINGTASSASVALEFTAMKEPARAPANAYYIAIGAMAAITVASTAGFYALKRRR
ncbi:hypothetical protein IX51_00655 [uncultured archaeon]|nr:hypothetical protein IX51_00655 [uncultured archaeon]